MLNLIIELSLVFVIAALIGWLMGRYLCKSGEYEERNKKNQLSKANTLIQKQLEQHEENHNVLLTKFNLAEKQISEQQQEITVSKGKITLLDNERAENLMRLQESSQCESRLSTTIEDLALEKQLHRKEKATGINLQNQLDEVNNQNKQQDKTITQIKKELESTTFELSNTIKAYDDQANDLAQIGIVTERHQAALKDNKQLHSTVKITQDENDSLKSRLQQSTEEFAQLQQKCSKLSEDSLDFADKLTLLNNEKHKLNQIIEGMTIEKNDYLGRLRAISSVVDVVGTEAIQETE